MSSQLDLLVVGSVALDTVETQAATRTEVLGGSASYFSAAASFLTSVGLVGVVGDDFPDEHAQFLTRLGVDSQGLERRDAGKTFRWHGRYSDDFNKRTSIDTQLNVFADFEPKLHPAHASARLLFLGNIDPTLQLRVLEQMKSVELVGLDTMNFWINGSREALLKVLRRVDFLLLNDEEARLLSGRHNLVHAAQAIQRLGPKNVVVKRGDAGALLFHDEHIFAAPALPLRMSWIRRAPEQLAGGFSQDFLCPNLERRTSTECSSVARDLRQHHGKLLLRRLQPRQLPIDHPPDHRPALPRVPATDPTSKTSSINGSYPTEADRRAAATVFGTVAATVACR
ncbi:MAG: PfkB family carbohydrate kinase [Polyangia bacterium]